MSLTQEQARQHALQAQRGNMRSLETLLRELIGGDISLDNLTVALATLTTAVIATLTATLATLTTAIIPSGGVLHNRGLDMPAMAVPETATDTATLTAAQMLSGVLVCTPTAAAAYTTLTGTLLLAELPSTIEAGDCFDLTIINLGGAGDIITLTGGTDVTVVGSATVDDAGADINSSGTFRFRYVGTTVFVAYRLN